MDKTRRLSYEELISYNSFEERFRYLKLNGSVGIDTFGFDRYLNQALYRGKDWKEIRDRIIIRDGGCDLGIIDRPIFGTIIIHHMNPLSIEDINSRNPDIFDPNFLICVSLNTHNAIHYGSEDILQKEPIVRTKNDTCPWKG